MTGARQPDKLDDLDRRIVAALQAAPRASWSQLGSVVAVSETTVMRRVQRLRDSGTLIILAAPDPLRCALGQPVHVYFETAPGEAPDLARSLAKRGGVRYVSLLAGTRDIMCELISPNHQELGRLLMGHLQKPEAVQRTTLVGAQAVYLQTDDIEFDLAVAPFTKDADLSIDPDHLGTDPRIAEAMESAGFTLKIKNTGGVEPGTWMATTKVDGVDYEVPVDLLVPETLAVGHSRRDARLPKPRPQYRTVDTGHRSHRTRQLPHDHLQPGTRHRSPTDLGRCRRAGRAANREVPEDR